MLVTQLPEESQTKRAAGAVKPGQWHNLEELVAHLIEVTFEGQRLFYKAHAKKGSQPPPPLKVPRPASVTGQTRPRKKPADSAELARFFGGRNVVVNYTPKAG